MIYELNIENAKEKSGQILLDRLIAISEGILGISEGALQLRLLGKSKKRGKKSIRIDDLLQIRLVGLKNQSTALLLDCDMFPDSILTQLSLFDQEPLKDMTPVSIFMDSFKVAFEEKESYYMDKPLLAELKAFKKSILSNDEIITISNQGSQDPLVLTSKKLEQIKIIEEEIPKPQKQILTGVIEELKYSKYRVKIQTQDGIVNSFISEKIKPEEIAKYWGKDTTLTGTMHFGIKGTRNFEIDRIGEPDESEIFRHIPYEQKSLLLEARKGNPLLRTKGKWPGDESLEELLNDS